MVWNEHQLSTGNEEGNIWETRGDKDNDHGFGTAFHSGLANLKFWFGPVWSTGTEMLWNKHQLSAGNEFSGKREVETMEKITVSFCSTLGLLNLWIKKSRAEKSNSEFAPILFGWLLTETFFVPNRSSFLFFLYVSECFNLTQTWTIRNTKTCPPNKRGVVFRSLGPENAWVAFGQSLSGSI